MAGGGAFLVGGPIVIWYKGICWDERHVLALSLQWSGQTIEL